MVRPQAEGEGPLAAAVAGHHMALLLMGSRHQVGVVLLHTLRMLLHWGLHTRRPRVGVRLLQGMPRVVVRRTEGAVHPRVGEHLRGTKIDTTTSQCRLRFPQVHSATNCCGLLTRMVAANSHKAKLVAVSTTHWHTPVDRKVSVCVLQPPLLKRIISFTMPKKTAGMCSP